jgi:hypothetical protein
VVRALVNASRCVDRNKITVVSVYPGTIGSPAATGTYSVQVATFESGLEALISPLAQVGFQYGKKILYFLGNKNSVGHHPLRSVKVPQRQCEFCQAGRT